MKKIPKSLRELAIQAHEKRVTRRDIIGTRRAKRRSKAFRRNFMRDFGMRPDTQDYCTLTCQGITFSCLAPDSHVWEDNDYGDHHYRVEVDIACPKCDQMLSVTARVVWLADLGKVLREPHIYRPHVCIT